MKSQSSKDWLEEFNEGIDLQQVSIQHLRNIVRNLHYTFPHIAEDISLCVLDLEESSKNLKSSINSNMREQIQNGNKFIGTALKSLIKD